MITTKEPDPRLPSLPVYILPKHIWEKYGPKDVGSFSNTNPVTSGPFRLTAWNKGSYFEMTANKNYWGGKPAVDKVRFRIFEQRRGHGGGAEERRDRRDLQPRRPTWPAS